MKKKKWTRFRHRVVTRILANALYPYSKWKYGLKLEKVKERRQYLILMNHQTAFDQFFVGMAFPGAIYYVASEDLFSKGWVSSLIRYLVAPIPIKKQTTDVQAVMNCIRIAREGGAIAIAPEGNRTYSGRPCYMNPAIAPLVKKLKLPLALFRIEGGYGVQPRWSDVVRKGTVHCYVSKIIEPEEYGSMTNEELLDLIQRELNVDEGTVSGTFRHPKLAEYLERAMYICPTCGFSVFESKKDLITCKKCGKQIRYLPTKELEGEDFPFRFTTEWYDYQCNYVNQYNPMEHCDNPIYTEKASVSEVILCKRRNLIYPDAELRLYSDRIEIEDQVFPFPEISGITVLGRNKVNIYHGKRLYQLKGDKRFNGLKYVNLFHRYKNYAGGEENGKFLGL